MKQKYKDIIIVSCAALAALAVWLGYAMGHSNGYKDGSKDSYDYAECLFRNGGSEALSDPPKCIDSKGEHAFPKAP